MDIPLLDYVMQLSTIDTIVFVLVMLITLYIVLTNKISILMFLLVLSAAMFATTLSVVSNVASVARWLFIVLMFIAGIFHGKMRISFGIFLLWGYVLLGFVSLLRGYDLIWQIQKSILLIMVSVAIPYAYGDKTYNVFKSSLVLIALVSAIYSIINFTTLPNNLSSALRFYGLGKGAPTFSVVLGALLPFSFWGAWKANSKIIKGISGVGFALGIILLLFSGQRAGIVTGLVGLVPMSIVFMTQKKNIGWAFILFSLIAIVGYYFYSQSSAERLDFLTSRYSLEAGLSNRDFIWQDAIQRISRDPFLGRGIGAAEMVVSYSFHNAYLEIWYNTGVLGLTLFLCSQFYFIAFI